MTGAGHRERSVLARRFILDTSLSEVHLFPVYRSIDYLQAHSRSLPGGAHQCDASQCKASR